MNDGTQHFRPVVVAHTPTHFVVAALGDLDANGVPAIMTGGMHAHPPFDKPNSVVLWQRK